MAVQLRLACDPTDDAESLYRWLRDEPSVRVDGRLARARNDDPEELGPLLDVLTLIIGSGLSAGQLALSIAEWRRTRPAAPVVTIVHTAPDGGTTRIEMTDPEVAEAALRRLEQRQGELEQEQSEPK